jgi:hypothetical protein
MDTSMVRSTMARRILADAYIMASCIEQYRLAYRLHKEYRLSMTEADEDYVNDKQRTARERIEQAQ